jgi:uncharacterized protein DUF2865
MALRTLLALLVLATAVLGPQAVYAQGLFQFFFGQQPSPRPRWVPPQLNAYPPYDNGFPQERPETFRTLCVRTCDGYYFPISFSTVRSEFARDADKCTASCGSEARLFYYANPGGKVEDMVDLSGFGYASLPNAFKYRQTLVGGCACKPEPWSDAELKRHQSYAKSKPAAPSRQGPSRTATPDADASYGLPSPRNGYAPGIPFSPKRGSPAGFWR